MSELAIGSRVLHRGYTNFEVVEIQKHPRGVIATFENERYLVKCNAAELILVNDALRAGVLQGVGKEYGDAFFLPGRIRKMPGELSVIQSIALGLKKGNLSPEAAERKQEKFKDLIEAERVAAEKAEAERSEFDG